MSFWSKLGHGLLKIAPIAAAFIPGVGPLASMAIGAGTSALDKKLSGGSWMDTLKAGAIGGATGFAGAKIPVKGIGPGKGFWSTAGNVAKRTGESVLARGLPMGGGGGQPMDERGGNISRYANTLSNVMNQANFGGSNGNNQAYMRGQGGDSMGGNQQDQAVPRGGGVSSFGRRMQRQLGPVMGAEDQGNPNLALALGSGRMDAMRDQPFRSGYDVYSQGPEPADDADGNIGPDIVSRMPPIGRQRRQRVAY